MKRAKHNKEKKMERLILIILIIIILIALFLVIFFIVPRKPKQNDKKNENVSIENEAIVEQEPEPEPEPEQFEMVDTSDLPDTYKGYKVLGKIVIEKLGIEHKILYATEEQQEDALNYGVTWFWGPDVNEPR